MIYEFISDQTGQVIERSFPMSEVPTEFEENKVKYRRHWVFSKSIIIPFQWGSGDNRPKFNKSPSGKKHYY